MTANDPETLAFYADEAVRYANQSQARAFDHLDAYLALLSPGARILELGCGGGDDTAHMLARGFDVVPTDGSPEIAAEAQKRLGIAVDVLQFEHIAADNAYDGVWASAGTAEGRDRFGRYFNYPSPQWLRQAYGEDRWHNIDIAALMGSGYDREPTQWLHHARVKGHVPGIRRLGEGGRHGDRVGSLGNGSVEQDGIKTEFHHRGGMGRPAETGIDDERHLGEMPAQGTQGMQI
eukprot:gene27702-33484_t